MRLLGSDQDQLHFIYYFPLDRPDLIFIFDKGKGKLTIYNMDDDSEHEVDVVGYPELVSASTNKQLLWIATIPSALDDPKERKYYLVNLDTYKIVNTEMNIGKNLFLVPTYQ